MEKNKSPKFDLKDYQEQADQKIDKIYETSRFAGAVMPTGAGKSFLAMNQLLKAGGNIPPETNDGIINNSTIVFVAPTNEITEHCCAVAVPCASV